MTTFPQLLCACSAGQVANDFLRVTGAASLFSLVAASWPLCALASGFASWHFDTIWHNGGIMRHHAASCGIIWHHATSLPEHSPVSVTTWHVLCIETYWHYLWSFDFMSLLRWTWHFLILSLRDPLALALSHLSTSVHIHPLSPESHWMMQKLENFVQNIVQKSSKHLSEHGQEKSGEYMLYCHVLLSVPRCYQNLIR